MGLLFMMAVRFYPQISYLVRGFMQAGIGMITSAKSQFWFGHANDYQLSYLNSLKYFQSANIQELFHLSSVSSKKSKPTGLLYMQTFTNWLLETEL